MRLSQWTAAEPLAASSASVAKAAPSVPSRVSASTEVRPDPSPTICPSTSRLSTPVPELTSENQSSLVDARSMPAWVKTVSASPSSSPSSTRSAPPEVLPAARPAPSAELLMPTTP